LSLAIKGDDRLKSDTECWREYLNLREGGQQYTTGTSNIYTWAEIVRMTKSRRMKKSRRMTKSRRMRKARLVGLNGRDEKLI
jgi:hypothetical protein